MRNIYLVIRNLFLSLFLLWFIPTKTAFAQSNADGGTITYEEIYDAPYEINRLFVHFQPLYGELFVTNVNVGFGLEVNYYLKDKFDFKAHARKAYTKTTDFARDVAEKNSDVGNIPDVYNYFELGATYHIVDREEDTETKVILYSDRFKGNKWAARVPEYIKVPSKVRKIYGARLGGIAYNSSSDLNRAMDKQEVVLEGLDENVQVFGNVDVKGLYIGGSLGTIKNFAIKPDKGYGVLSSDLIFNAFIDVVIAPSVHVEDIIYQGTTYAADAIKTSMLGARIGMEGKFNRELGWAYGAEIGYRPGIANRGTFILLKISLPVYGTSIDNRKEAFGK